MQRSWRGFEKENGWRMDRRRSEDIQVCQPEYDDHTDGSGYDAGAAGTRDRKKDRQAHHP